MNSKIKQFAETAVAEVLEEAKRNSTTYGEAEDYLGKKRTELCNKFDSEFDEDPVIDIELELISMAMLRLKRESSQLPIQRN